MHQTPDRRKSYRAEDGYWVLWLDKRRRLTLPKALREELSWEVGDTLELSCVSLPNGRQTLRVFNPDAESRKGSTEPMNTGDLRAILQEIDPTWSGRVPPFSEPLHPGAPGSETVEELFHRERER